MTVYCIYWTKMHSFIFQNNQKIVQTMLKWLFSTSININLKHIIFVEVFVSIPLAFYPMMVSRLPRVWGKKPLLPPHTFIWFLNKMNNLIYLFSHKICCSINVPYKVYIFFAIIHFRRSEKQAHLL